MWIAIELMCEEAPTAVKYRFAVSPAQEVTCLLLRVWLQVRTWLRWMISLRRGKGIIYTVFCTWGSSWNPVTRMMLPCTFAEPIVGHILRALVSIFWVSDFGPRSWPRPVVSCRREGDLKMCLSKHWKSNRDLISCHAALIASSRSFIHGKKCWVTNFRTCS